MKMQDHERPTGGPEWNTPIKGPVPIVIDDLPKKRTHLSLRVLNLNNVAVLLTGAQDKDLDLIDVVIYTSFGTRVEFVTSNEDLKSEISRNNYWNKKT